MLQTAGNKNGWLILSVVACVFILLPLYTYADTLKPFASDGCSLFPDEDIISKVDWCQCCFEHDVAYWQGGTQKDRKRADKKLKACVLKVTDDPLLAGVMYEGVRFGGSPYFYNWYRWGYGWPYARKYQPLTQQESLQAQAHLEKYLLNAQNTACGL